jgi:hypothetical protein
MSKMNNRATIALCALLGVTACTPEDYPLSPRFDPPPEEIVLPDGELFFYVPPAGAPEITSVSVPGEFNGWNAGAPEAQMQLLSDGRWVVGLDLEDGTYKYKFHFNGNGTANGAWAGNMCGDATYGDPAHGDTVDLDLDSCDGEDAVRTVGTPQPAGHTFRYITPEGVEVTQVNVVGEMNGWSAPDPALEMAEVWSITVDLAAGTYQYKYHFNGDSWADNMCNSAAWGDPNNDGKIDPDVTGCVGNDNNAQLVMDEAGSHTFRYVVPDGLDVSQVNLVGEMNGWSAPDPALAMQQEFSITLELEPGTYQYKYHFNGTTWADNMCNSAAWGHPDFDNKIDPDVVECIGNDNNGLLTIE